MSSAILSKIEAIAGRVAEPEGIEIVEIELTLPNKHYLLADLAPFGQTNRNEIFVPIDEPHGYIEARIRREG